MLTVVAPSTLLTSFGTILLFVASGIVMMLILALEQLRRYTAGLRGVEDHPYTSIAAVAGTVIIFLAIFGGWLIAGVHWLQSD